MRDVAQEAEARARCDAALHAAGDRARALADKLQVAPAPRLRGGTPRPIDRCLTAPLSFQINEEELAGQMKIVLEMRGEKVRSSRRS